MSRHWSVADVRVVKEYYPDGGVDAVVGRLSKERTADAIKSKAAEIGVFLKKSMDYRWKADEINIILDAVKRGISAKEVQKNFLQHRGLPAVRLKLEYVTLQTKLQSEEKKTTSPGWSQEEIEIIKSVYPEGGARDTLLAIREKGFFRTRRSIKAMAHKLRIKTKKRTALVIPAYKKPNTTKLVGKKPSRKVFSGDLIRPAPLPDWWEGFQEEVTRKQALFLFQCNDSTLPEKCE